MASETVDAVAVVLNFTRDFLDEGPNGLAESMVNALSAVVSDFDRLDFLQKAGVRDEWGNII